MIRIILHNGLRFIVLITLQVTLFKNMGYYNLAAPYPYIFFLLLLPIGIPNVLLYLIAFLTGITVDAFYDTLGVHAAACTALALTRIAFVRITLEPDHYDRLSTPLLGEMPFQWFLPYLFFTTITHHLALYMLAVFSFAQFHYTLLSTIFSCIFTVVIMLLFSLLLYRRKRR